MVELLEEGQGLAGLEVPDRAETTGKCMYSVSTVLNNSSKLLPRVHKTCGGAPTACGAGAGGCGKNSQCDKRRRVCVCNADQQDYPHCCWPSCK